MRRINRSVTLAISTLVCGPLVACSSSTSPKTGDAGRSTPHAPVTTTSSAAGGGVAAPSSAPSSAPVAPGKGACKYVTTQQASALAHSPVKPGVLRSSANGPITTESCYYFFKGGNEPGVFIATADLDGNGPALFAELRTENRNFDSEYRSVPGVGDDAFYANQNLTILSGNTGVILFVGRANGESRGRGGIPDEKKLAALVLPQL